MADRQKHGSFIRLEDLESLHIEFATRILAINSAVPVKALAIDLKAYDYLFKDLVADPANLLDGTKEVIQGLKDLGAAMKEESDATEGDTGIPAAYTYLGQFIDHDITLEATSNEIANAAFETDFFEAIPPNDLRKKLKNTRSGTFDLDSVYNENAPRENDGRFKIGNVTPVGQRPPNKTDANDLPRKADERRTAQIGDPRNDENTIIAQLHVSFLKFHNAVMNKRRINSTAAERIVRQHYQWIVIHDYLKRVCDPTVVDKILTDGNEIFNPTDDQFFMPVEFSAAAYRFGHSMVRKSYDFNEFFNRQNNPATLDLLFKFTGLSGDMANHPTLPENWIIEWENVLPFDLHKNVNARKIDTALTVALEHLPGTGNAGIFQFLAKRNLLRGYLLSLPTGQALARRVLDERDVLTSEQIMNNASEQEKTALQTAGLHIKTPLWYYILAEASIHAGGTHLGKLGSLIVAETIIGLIRRSADSILNETDWKPTLGDIFGLEQMIRFSELGPGQREAEVTI